jgi:hypothetical protein
MGVLSQLVKEGKSIEVMNSHQMQIRQNAQASSRIRKRH